MALSRFTTIPAPLARDTRASARRLDRAGLLVLYPYTVKVPGCLITIGPLGLLLLFLRGGIINNTCYSGCIDCIDFY